mmetsp:Transcript_38971/g.81505  ORF Transcript_38971/g.81505 Transcript_38971/m.81505 type:complete len:320 (+) Transcript_38971:36-995(+)
MSGLFAIGTGLRPASPARLCSGWRAPRLALRWQRLRPPGKLPKAARRRAPPEAVLSPPPLPASSGTGGMGLSLFLAPLHALAEILGGRSPVVRLVAEAHQQRLGREDHTVARPGQNLGDLLRRRNPSELDEARIRLDRISDHRGRLPLSLGMDDCLLLLFLGLQDQVPCTLRLLLCHLLGLHSLLILRAEVEVRNRHIVQEDVEVIGALHQPLPDHAAHELALHDELGCVVLRYHALQHLVDNRRQHFLVKVRAERPVHVRELAWVWLAKGAQRNIHHLQVAAAGKGGQRVRPRTNVKNHWPLKPGQHKVQALPVGLGS